MGLFDFFKKNSAEDSVELLTCTYNNSVNNGKPPKLALYDVYRQAQKVNDRLRYLTAEDYFESVYKKEFVDLSSNNSEARKFVVRVIQTLMSVYFHPETNILNVANPGWSDFKSTSHASVDLDSLIESKIIKTNLEPKGSTVVSCPKCQSKFKAPKGKHLEISCKSCRHKWKIYT